MKIPMSWLSDYLDMTGITPDEYNHRMTMTGSKVEGITSLGDEITQVVTAKILSAEQHPDADKLKVCMVDTGNETLQIITGADNIKPGQIVPVALDGATLPGGKKIKTGKLRGLESYGMMCSYQELGMAKEDFPHAEDGILILDNNLPLGKDVKEVFGLNEQIVEFEITSNRPDCFSVIGLARETAVSFDRPFHVKTPVVKGVGEDIKEYAKVSVQEGTLCTRYSAKVVKNVTIAPSPSWMQQRLKACGIRAINNIVDITNYVLLEYGQPMHAFDLSYLEGGEINVRRAKNGETMTTLDGVPRTLDSSMLVICDANKPVALGGVMGGENSEVKGETRTILFESAHFLGSGVRMTAKKLGLRTESSSRYEKGLDPCNTVPALLRACELIEQLGCGQVVDGMIDVNNAANESVQIPFDPHYINEFMGTDISTEFMVKTLTDLGFHVEDNKITVPSFRPDVEGGADIAEEIIRIYGYDKIPSTLLTGTITEGKKSPAQLMEDKVKQILTACGLYEIITYSFTNPNIFDRIGLESNSPLRNTVVITNPLGSENSIMRTTTIPSMMEILSRNVNHKVPAAKLFELGKVYIPAENQPLPEERTMITLGIYGACDFYDLKGYIEALLEGLGIRKYKVLPVTDNGTFHPGRTAVLQIGNHKAGIFGQVHPAVCDNYDISGAVYMAEISFDILLQATNLDKTYMPLPKYPAVVRDLAIIVDEHILAADVEEIIRKKAKNLFAGLTLFDVYQGKQVPQGKKSMAYSITLQSNEKTLVDQDSNNTISEILKALGDKLGAHLR